VDEYGFLVTPYQKVKHGKLLEEIEWLRADQEHEARLAPADALIENGKLVGDSIIARSHGDFQMVPVDQVQYIDVAPSQMVGVSAGLIPFLEHDDANRALMGSNMQRQAVPLLITEPPLVATGMEIETAKNSSMPIRALNKGSVAYVDAKRIEIGSDVYHLRKFVGLNERTCQNQKPIVALGDKGGEGPDHRRRRHATYQGEWPWGATCLVSFMAWDGFNFEDAIIISEELVMNDTYTSIHIEEFDIEIRETKLGREEFHTATSPTSARRCCGTWTRTASSASAAYVEPGDVLVGKVSPEVEDRIDARGEAVHRHFRPGPAKT